VFHKSLPWLANIRVPAFLLLIIGALSLVSGSSTSAYYNTSAASASNTFTAGSIQLQISDSNKSGQETITSSIVANVAANQWRPGHKVTAPITLINTGNLDLTYGLTYTAADSGTKPDGGASTPTQFLKLSIKGKGNGNGNSGACTTTNFSIGSKWQEDIIIGQTLATGATALWPDTTRTVAANDSEVLCFQVEFTDSGPGVENDASGGASTVSFNFIGRR
jgi:predicted ribosomally synthesized peptide with SipW-like signal peptide